MPATWTDPKTGQRYQGNQPLPAGVPNQGSAVAPTGQAGLTATSSNQAYDPSTGQTSYSTQFGLGLDKELATRDKYNQAAEARRVASMQSLIGGTGGPGARVSRMSGPTAEQAEAARQAAFARAKDRTGKIARSSLDALQSAISDRGLGAGSTFEAAQTGRILGGGEAALGEFEREQAILDATEAGRLGDVQFQGDITQRGQDISRQQSLLSLLNQAGVIY